MISVKGGLLAIAAVLLLVQFPATQAQQEYQVGAQVCQYMNLNQAKKLEYRSEGVLNTNTVDQWVVCPIANVTPKQTEQVNSAARVSNKSNVGAEVQCLWKLTDANGVPFSSQSVILFVDVGQTGNLFLSNLEYVGGLTLTISCKLPPQFQAVSFFVEN